MSAARNVCLKLNVPFPAEPQRYPKPGTHLPSSVSLQYYRPSAARGSPLTWNDNAHEDRPWVRVARDSYATPEVRYEALPDGAWWSDAETGVLQEAFWPENFGHSMGDDFLPIFRLASAFGLWDRSTVQAIMHPPCWSRGYWERGCAHHDELAPLLLDRPYETYNGTLFSSVSPDDQSSGHVCFRHLLVGTARLGMGYPSEHLWPRFLAELKRGAGLSPALGPKKQRITILVKHGRRTILNYAEVEHGLRSRFGVEVEAVDPAEMGLVEQLQYMQETTVVVSPCGGVSFSAIFLPKGASPVFVDYWDVRYNTTSQMERFIYTSNDNITPFYYPVEFDDLSLDRTQIPGWFREHEAEWEIWRNWANVTINVERMERYVLSDYLVWPRSDVEV
ncbi:hypothetical protein Rhopal_007407-T1 [Rhodotorula paludigena]|uniref:Glycosyltransferase 61 catalytic domain-containing protein n=1 Tax=Rhodotorula paludigena TaxID=86838 RepID=A0AAV5GVM2_9BASI|nr:hypothetical protein Rhopal_007407-T1 [Rhodotorula paludigena]